MKRLRWKKPWHYIILLAAGFTFGFGLGKTIDTYPDPEFIFYGFLGLAGFIAWIMIDVQPDS